MFSFRTLVVPEVCITAGFREGFWEEGLILLQPQNLGLFWVEKGFPFKGLKGLSPFEDGPRNVFGGVSL